MTGTYYCDLFKINGKGCVVMGSGKSMACAMYTGQSTQDIMRDFARFDIENGKLYAYGDLTIGGAIDFDMSKAPKIKIDYFIWMQFEYEPMVDGVKEITRKEFRTVADFNVIFGVSDDTIEDRRIEFGELISQDEHLRFIKVPWCETVEQKGKLISEYIK